MACPWRAEQESNKERQCWLVLKEALLKFQGFGGEAGTWGSVDIWGMSLPQGCTKERTMRTEAPQILKLEKQALRSSKFLFLFFVFCSLRAWDSIFLSPSSNWGHCECPSYTTEKMISQSVTTRLPNSSRNLASLWSLPSSLGSPLFRLRSCSNAVYFRKD